MLSPRQQRRIAHHIANFGSPDKDVSSRAEVYMLRYYGVKALEPLLEACNHPIPMVRLRAAWVLGYTQHPEALETILRLVDDPDERVRYDATIALGIHGDDRSIEPLIRLLFENDYTRPAALALARLGLKAVPALSELINYEDRNIRAIVLDLLCDFAFDLGDMHCFELITSARNDPDAEIRSEIDYWLEKIEAKDAAENGS